MNEMISDLSWFLFGAIVTHCVWMYYWFRHQDLAHKGKK